MGCATSRLALAAAVFSIAAAGQGQAQTQLEPIVIEGSAGVVTEGTGSYTTERATVGGKQPQDIREVPQTVVVVTREAIEDRGATTIEEAAYVVPGLTTALGDPWTGSLYARGQEVFQYYVDGAPRPFLSLYGTAPDLFFFDRMEIMSGPSGVYQGSGEPVGTINLVRKRPTKEFQGSASGSYNTFNGYRGEVDAGGALNESGTVRARVAAYGENEDSYVDIINSERKGVFGTIEIDVTPSTTVSVGAIVEDNQNIRFSGLPTYTDGSLVDFPRSTFIGAPWNNFEMDTKDYFAEIEHTFDYGGVLKVMGRYYDRTAINKSLLGLTGVDPATGDFDVFTFARDYFEETGYLDANLTSPLNLWGRRGEIVMGADYRQSDQYFQQNFVMGYPTQNIATFDPGAFPEPAVTFPGVGPGFRTNRDSLTTEYGLYSQGRLELLDGLKLNLGGRFAWYDSETIDIGRNRVLSSNTIEEFVPYAGLTYDLTSQVTLYVSHAEIFQPQFESGTDGALPPRIGTQLEFGAKAKLFDDRIYGQASYYIINDENRAVSDIANPGFFIAAEEAETSGFELTVSGSPIDGVQFIAGYAYVDTDLESDPSSPHNFVAFAKYSFPEASALAGWTFGGGVRAASSFDIVTDAHIEAPGYVVFDALVAYDFDPTLGVQLNVYNIFDNEYITRVNETTRGTFYGEPVNATLKLTKKF